MRIALIHPGKAYLPELIAYREYFSAFGCEVEERVHPTLKNLDGFDVEWHFMGRDRLSRVPGRVKVHEYVSLSLPPFARAKDRIKRWTNVRPDLRVFQTPLVEAGFGFSDQVPSLLRGIGLDSHFFNEKGYAEKSFDFVYHGAMDRSRSLRPMLQFFQDQIPHQSLLLVGAPGGLKTEFGHADNIHFVGPVAYKAVPKYLRSARYGINWVPDTYPHNLQPFLKTIEYCASGLKVLSTDCPWVREFESSRNAKFYPIRREGPLFDHEALAGFPFRTPDVSDLAWEKVLDRAGLHSALLSLMEETSSSFRW